MPLASVPKHHVALELLDRSIELYLRGDSFYAALHLGGAAEELLAVYARGIPITPTTTLAPAFDQMKELVVALISPQSPAERNDAEKWAHDRLNSAKNSVKHKRGPKDDAVNIDSKEEAYDVIDRAVATYFQLLPALRLPHLQSVQAFDSRRRSECNE